MPLKRTRTAAAVLTALLVPCAAAPAMEFTFNAAPGTPQEVIDGFVAAGQRWSAIFDDPVRIRIDIEFTDLASNSLGETVNYYYDLSWTAIRSRLVSDATSADDALAVAALPSSGGIPILINRTSNSPHGPGSATPYLDNDGDANNTNIRTPIAIQRALGLSGIGATTDAVITFNQDYLWDFDPTNGIAANRYDFVGIATHEIGHALGVLSGVDALDGAATPLRDDQLNAVTLMDIFRISEQSASLGAIDFTADTRNKFFSIGDAADVPLGTGVNFGDGSQASHWKDNTNSGIFDPSFSAGELLTITRNDRRLLDVMGYDRAAAWSWAKPASGDWGRPLNWASASDLNETTTGARFDSTGAYTVSINDVRDVRSVEVSAGAVTLQLVVGAAQLRVAEMMSVGAGSALALAGPSRFATRDVVNQGTFSHQAGSTLDVSGTFTNNAGDATLAGTQAWRPGSALVVNGGTVSLLTNATPDGEANIAVTVNGGALNLQASQEFQSLTMTAGTAALAPGGGKVLRTGSLDLGSATLDLWDNDLVVAADAASRDGVLAQVSELIRLARNASGGRWMGVGITSSAAAEVPSTTLAAVINPGFTEFSGQSVGPDDVIVMYTWDGDMNIDGLVNFDDYFRIDSGFLEGATGYAHGDLNYDGRINFDDYFLIDSSFLGQAGSLSTSAFAAASVSIPEPRILGFFALTAALALGRVRRPVS